MRAVIAIGLLTLGSTTAGAGPDCALGQRYVNLAHERLAAAENGQAENLLRQAIDACPSYEAYQTLGELQAQSPRRTDQAHAVDAFVEAHALAPTGAARARTLYRYASLLTRDGDPQNAYPLIRDAQRLDPSNNDIAHLSSQIEGQVRNPTQEHIIRGLWHSLYKPLRSGPTPPGAPPARNSGPSVNIPIDFITGSTSVSRQTQANVALLANALADTSHATQRFLFVGHADLPGDESANVLLSKQRAEAIYAKVIALQPSLKGRIDLVGHGSAEPIDADHDERAQGSNGRLQVFPE